MRTTVDLPDELLRNARRKAAEEGTTLTALLADGLRLRLDDANPRRAPARRLPVSTVYSRGSTRRPTPRCWTRPTTTLLLPDVNAVLAAFRADHAHHELAVAFLEQGAELVTFDRGFGRYPGLPWSGLLDA